MNHLSNNKARGSALTPLIGGIVILFAVLFFLVKLATSGYYSDVEASTPSATQTRIMPAGSVTMGDGTPVGQRTGEQIFNKICIQCHAADGNIPNAPRVTHNNEWAPRIAKGFETLFNNALNGFNAMPAKGGQADLTDDELKRAIAYMANQSGGNLEAPAVGGASGAAASGTDASAASPASSPAASDAAGAAAPAAATASADGKKIFDTACAACHGATSAIPNSPKITKNDEWAPRIKQGKETLFKHALEGFTGPSGSMMPAKGGNASLTDDEVKAAVTYMVNESGGKI